MTKRLLSLLMVLLLTAGWFAATPMCAYAINEDDPSKKKDKDGESDGDPIRLLDGAFTETCTDFRLPGVGVDFVVQRTYASSSNPVTGAVMADAQNGVNWRNNYAMRLRRVDASHVAVVYSADTEVHFTVGQTANGYTSYTPGDGESRDKLRQKTTGDKEFELDTGEMKYVFYDVDNAEHLGRLWSIGDKAGHALTLGYPLVGGKTLYNRITDTMGRTHLVDRYATPGYLGRVQRVVVRDTGDNDIAWIEYGYNSAYDLVRVVLTDKTAAGTATRVWLYKYDANHQLLYIVDPAGYKAMCDAGVKLGDNTALAAELADARWVQDNPGTTPDQLYGVAMLDPAKTAGGAALTESDWRQYAMVLNSYGTSGENLRRLVKQVWEGRNGEGRESAWSWDEDPEGVSIGGVTVKMLATETVKLDSDTTLKTVAYYLDASGRELRKEVRLAAEYVATEKRFDAKGRLTDLYENYIDLPSGDPEATKLHYKYCYKTGLTINGQTVTESGDERDHVTWELVSDGSSWRKLAHYEYGYYSTTNRAWNHLVTRKEVFTEAASGALATLYYYDNDADQSGPDDLTYGLLTKVVSPEVTSGLDSGQAAYSTVRKYTYYAVGEGSAADDNQVRYEDLCKLVDSTETDYVRKEYTYHTSGNGIGQVKDVTLDPSGLALKTGYTYDAAGNTNVVTTDPDEGGLQQASDFDYDPWGNLLKVTSPEGYASEYARDRSGRATKVTTKDASANLLSQVEYEYNVYGELVKTRRLFGTTDNDANKRIGEVVKDFSGSTLAVSSIDDERQADGATPRGGSKVEYNARGLVVKRYIADGWNGSAWASTWQSVEYEHDWAGRVKVVKTYKDNGSGQRSTNPVQQTETTYDSWGRPGKIIEKEADSGGTLQVVTRTNLTYDNLDRITKTVVLCKDTDSPASGDYLAITRTLYDQMGRAYETQLVSPTASNLDGPTDAEAASSYVFRDEYGRTWKTRDDEGNTAVLATTRLAG